MRPSPCRRGPAGSGSRCPKAGPRPRAAGVCGQNRGHAASTCQWPHPCGGLWVHRLHQAFLLVFSKPTALFNPSNHLHRISIRLNSGLGFHGWLNPRLHKPGLWASCCAPAHIPTPGDPRGPQCLNVPHFIDKEMRIWELELLPLDEPLARSGERCLTPRPSQNRRGLFLQVALARPVL